MDGTSEPASSDKGFKRKRHRKQRDSFGPAANTGDQPYTCAICNDEALSYNFGVICCESCKAFYRRSLTSKRTYACANGGRCEINRETRKFCPHCRMQKCIEAGMSSDPLTSAYLDAVQSGSCARRTLRRRKGRNNASPNALCNSVDTQSSVSVNSRISSPNADFPPIPSNTLSSSAAFSYVSSPDVKPNQVPPIKQLEEPDNKVIIHPKWRKQSRITNADISSTLPISDADYESCLLTCKQFAELMQMPFSLDDLGPVSENLMPDDPVAMSRFPEATLRRYVAAMKKVPEFQKDLCQTERFWLLKTNLLCQQAVVISYFGDPFDLCFYGTVANGATFRHSIEYSIEQFGRAGADSRYVIESMMTFYRHIRENFPADDEWPIAAAFLCIIKLFSPKQYETKNESNKIIDIDVDIAHINVKTNVLYNKYNGSFMRFVQNVRDRREKRALSSNINVEVRSFCERLLDEAHIVCALCAAIVEQLTRAFRENDDSSDVVPLWMELNSA